MHLTLLHTAFPFHIAMNSQLEITGFGDSLRKLGLGIGKGDHLSEHFSIKTPPTDVTLEDILEQAGTVFFLVDHGETITLKGQMAPATSSSQSQDMELLFLGSPVLAKLEDVGRLGLTLNDFAPHDTTTDYLILMQTQANMLRDTRQLAGQLQEEIAIRKKAQEELTTSNLRLEDTVEERTRELRQSNEMLQIRNDEMLQLNAIGERLHGCQSVEEAFPVVMEGVVSLFPGSAGRLVCYDEKQKAFTGNVFWGGDRPCPGPVSSSQECTAMRTRRMHSSEDRCNRCPRHTPEPGQEVLCRPLLVGDHLLGLLQLWYKVGRAPDLGGGDEEWRKSRHALVLTLTEHIGLALSNLRMKERLEAQAIRDPLTGLYNRRHMEAFLEREMNRVSRNKGRIGLVLLDVDHFKHFNDTHGHQAGDEVLVQLAQLLESKIRKGDIACRYGGEEFLLVLNGASLEQSLARAEDIRSATAEQLHAVYNGVFLGPVTISLGVVELPLHGKTVEEAFQNADAALYEAKHQGRNRAVVCGEAPWPRCGNGAP